MRWFFSSHSSSTSILILTYSGSSSGTRDGTSGGPSSRSRDRLVGGGRQIESAVSPLRRVRSFRCLLPPSSSSPVHSRCHSHLPSSTPILLSDSQSGRIMILHLTQLHFEFQFKFNSNFDFELAPFFSACHLNGTSRWVPLLFELTPPSPQCHFQFDLFDTHHGGSHRRFRSDSNLNSTSIPF